MSSSSSQVQNDAHLARALAEAEVAEARQREAYANMRAWDSYNSRQPYYYYGTWRSPRPVVVYREDPCLSIWFLWCFFIWLIIFFIAIILIVIYV